MDLQMGQTPVSCTIYEPGVAWDHRPPKTEEEPEPLLTLPPPLLAPVSPGVEQVDARTLEQERVPPQRVWRVVPAVERPRAPAWVIGSLVHEALAAWRFPDGEGAAAFGRWAEARARAYGVTDGRQLEDAVRQSERLLSRFQSHPLYQEMNGAERRLHEVPYSLLRDEGVESGVIDALYLREGVWRIVEFKTDRVRNEAELEALLAEEDYLAQARRYIEAVERLVGGRPGFVLCMLNYAGGVRLRASNSR